MRMRASTCMDHAWTSQNDGGTTYTVQTIVRRPCCALWVAHAYGPRALRAMLACGPHALQATHACEPCIRVGHALCVHPGLGRTWSAPEPVLDLF